MLTNRPIVKIADKKLESLKLSDVSLGTHVGYRTYNRSVNDPSGAQTKGSLVSRTFNVNATVGAMSSKPYLYYELPVVITGSAGSKIANATSLKNKVGLKQLGGNKMVLNYEVSINKYPRSTDHVKELCDMLCVSETREVLSEISPVFKADNSVAFNLDTSIRNVLADGDQSDPNEMYSSRGLYGNGYMIKDLNIDATGNGTASFTLCLKTAVIADPFQYRSVDPSPLYNVSSVQVKVTYNQNPLRNLFNIAESTWTVAFDTSDEAGAPNVQLLLDEFEPSYVIKKPTVPLAYNVPEIEYDEQLKDTAVPADNKKIINFTSDKYTGMGIPSLMAICMVDARYDNSTDTARYHDVPHRTLQITKFGVSINNEDQKLFDISQPEVLYEISRSCGYNLDLANFTNAPLSYKRAGNPAADVPIRASNGWLFFRTTDFGLSDAFMGSNVNAPFNIKFHIQCVNNTGVAFTKGYKFKFYRVMDQVLVADGEKYELRPALIEPSRLAENDAEGNEAPVVFEEDNSKNVLGGNRFMDRLKRFGRKVGKFLKSDKAKEIASHLRNAPMVKKFVGDDTDLGKLAKKHGYGVLKIGKGGAAMSREALLKDL